MSQSKEMSQLGVNGKGPAMIQQEMLLDLTESYLKSLISDVSECLNRNFDSCAPFGELGINSFYVLKIIKRLEVDFGRLPKSLLFENFNINDLANYFVGKHEQVLLQKFAQQLQRFDGNAEANGHPVETATQKAKPAGTNGHNGQNGQHGGNGHNGRNGHSGHKVNGYDGSNVVERHGKNNGRPKANGNNAANGHSHAGQASEPVRILEKDAFAHPEFAELVQGLYERYKIEGCVSRGTRKIAPNLFIGSARRGYFNYGRSKNIILVYGYTGPRDYIPVLAEEMLRYCASKKFQLNILADENIESIGGTALSATPFGAMQRILNLKEFSLEGGAMRRLRYVISKFEKTGVCKTVQYRCGSNPETDKNIAGIIDRWSAARTMVNPLVQQFKDEALAGAVSSEHRLFLTYLDDVLQNAILITAMSQEANGYLMDLEFYPPDMPLGGLEFAIIKIIETLVAEGCDVLSLGGTYGCKLSSSTNADPEIDKILDDLRSQNIFNEEGNLQFKNKFRTENKTIFLCRPAGSGNADNVIDVIMMIADPEKVQTSDEENHTFSKARCEATDSPLSCEPLVEGNARLRILRDFGFNPINIPNEHVEFDLKTDSWAQLAMHAIDAQMKHLHGQLQQPVSVDDSLRAVFPFSHFVLTASGQKAEHIFFKAWPKPGVALQNLLFPSTIFHEIDKGFTAKELPHPAAFELNSGEPYKSNMDWEALQSQVAQDPSAIAFVVIEISNNAAGGYPVSMQHLKDVKKLLAKYSIPLVIDGTRVLENAQFLIEQEKEYADKSLWTVTREIFSHADAVIGSLTKDFCVNKGGIIATNDGKFFQRLQQVVQEEGAGIDLIDKKMIALSMQNRKNIEAKVLRRMEAVRLLAQALKEHKVPIALPAGGHCILIDVKQIPEFKDFKYPVASFVAWLYLNTGIRAAAHSVGMQKQTRINDMVRMAVPTGMKRDEVEIVIDRLVEAFNKKANIPEIVMETGAPQPSGPVHANYKLVKYHNVSENIATQTTPAMAGLEQQIATEDYSAVISQPTSTKPAPGISATGTLASEGVPQETESTQNGMNKKTRRSGDIAIIGMAGRYPKAKNPGQLWENLAQGRDCIEEIPADRYERRLQYGSVEKYRGGFIDEIDRFDSMFFNISPREAEMLDPQERLFLEVAWETIEDAGYYPEMLAQEDASRNIGVFVGAVWAMYQMLAVEERHAGNNIVPNSFLWSIANRVSYWFNLCGPSLTLDTACSSSLTALYLACEAIQTGECSAAIVGGVNLDLHQAKLDINQAGGALSADGVCRSFGKGANGYVGGEGIGALFLKLLDQAVQDGDHIYGVIKSVVVNHGGRTSGYTVPNPKAQTSLITSALEKANVSARSIGYIEAHGTGTELGDPIEITGLNQAFSGDQVENQTCAIGSIKSNIGHLEAAAGVVSISKVLLQMKHRQIAPSLHSAELNEFIDFQNSPFYVVQSLQEWKPKNEDDAQLSLRASISSFGAGGSNAHVILEEYKPSEHTSDEESLTRPLIFPLSAKNEDQLREMAVRLEKFLRQNRANLNDVAFTLQMGRKSFDHRVAIIAKNKEELLEKLSCFIDGKKADDLATGHVKGGEGITRLLNRREKEEFVRLLLQGRDPRKLAELWAEGLLADWHGLQPHGSGKRVPLPTYPFADRRHWAGKKAAVRHSLQRAAAIHPMVDTNESTFERQLFKKTFSECDFFIYDHIVANIPTLPGVAYLELARKAGEAAAGRPVRKIRNIIWVSPIAVQNSVPKEVFVELKPSGDTVQFEVFSDGAQGKVLHSQGKLLYTTKQEAAAEPEYIDLQSIRARCAKVIDGKAAYPKFKAFGLNLGPSFQVLQEVYKNESEILGVLQLPEFRLGDLESMILQPSLVDGSLQAGMGAQLGEKADEMFVPYSIGEVEILHPLQPNCFSYVTEAKEDKKKDGPKSRVLKTNVLIVDETGKVLVKIHESTGVPLREVHKKSEADGEGFSKLYYSYEWENAPLGAEDANQPSPQSILLFDTQERLRGLYQERIKATGANSAQVILVRPGESFKELDKQSYTINPQSKDDFARLFEVLVERNCSIENICFAWTLGQTDFRDESLLRESLERGVYSFLSVCQSIIKQKLESKVQLIYLYSRKLDEAQPHNEAIRGFVNSLRLEHPKLLCRAVEIRQEGSSYEQILDAVAAEFQVHKQDATAVRYDGQERYIRKLKAFEPEASQAVRLKEKGVYLITGGAGGLGLIFAEFLAKEHKAKLVLSGRSKLAAEGEAKLEKLRKSGAEVIYVPADVSSREDVKRLVGEVKAHFGEINGVIHSAGVLKDSLIRNKTQEEMSAVFASKIYGTLHLDALTKDEPLDFFVTFSSLAAVAGNGGQCDYSFANHFMDSLAEERELLRANGTRAGKTLSINWSLWADGGMKIDEQTELYFKKTLGMKPLSGSVGLEAFVQGLAWERSQFAVVEGVQEKLELAWGLRKKKPEPLATPSATPSDQAAAPASDAAGDLFQRLQDDLSQIVMEFLKLDANDMATDEILLDLGFDSIGLTTFANSINEKYHLDITPVLFFDYPTVGEIAKYLSAERASEIRAFYQGSTTTATIATPPPAAQESAKNGTVETHREATFKISKGWDPTASEREAAPVASTGGFSPEHRFVNMPIAIVGMSGVMPQSEDLEEFWENLKNSKDMITVVPPDRWNWEDCYGDPLKETNKTNSKWGGFMKEIDKFDPLFFGISPREAQTMDPQQRIFLETVWKAIEDSGQKVSDLSGTRTGLFVGVATNDYIEIMNNRDIALDGYSASGNSHSVLANRVSFLLNLRGPSAPLDTACSSSLVALHRAIESIHTGSCDMAIVGGVQVMLSPAAYISFSMAGMLSGDGKCKTFDKRANGYVRGEGAGAIFLKPLAAAEADGNHIYAVIKATAENHGGKVTTLTAPNSSAQTALLIEAYEKAHIDPSTVGYIECHGTGTSLGDPIEIQALSKAFSDLYKKHNKAVAETPHCGLSAVKTNIGHLETAAGIAGVLKVLLAIKHKHIPAVVHFEEINPYINLKGTPFYIADKFTPWEAVAREDGTPIPRRAGISSFGFGGANAHIVMEEYIPSKRPAATGAQGPQLIVLSAKNENRLKAYMQSMYEFLEKEDVELADFAYTLQVGRDEMPERMALVASSMEELKQKLQQMLKGEKPKDSYRHNIRSKEAKSQTVDGAEGEALVQALIERKELSKLAELWVSGTKVDWSLFYKPGTPRRISIPTYPFAKERHWIPDAGPKVKVKEERRDLSRAGGEFLHPLVHRSVSTLEEHKFTSQFCGEEFYFADHVVQAQKMLPGVAYMEMARAAGELSGTAKVRVIRNLIWERPLIAGNNVQEVEISLTTIKDDTKFSIKTQAKEGPVVHCTGKLAYSFATTEPEVLDIAKIQDRCYEPVMSGEDLYPFLCSSGLKYGTSFQIVQRIYANESESLAILQWPEHLRKDADQFCLHPALMDGSLHTIFGLVKKNGMELPLYIPSSVGEVQIFHSLQNLYYGYATWAVDNPKAIQNILKVTFHLLDKNGKVLVRMKDFVSRPIPRGAAKAIARARVEQPKGATVQKETKAPSQSRAPRASESTTRREEAVPGLQSLVPIWTPVYLETSKQTVVSPSAEILLLGGDQSQLDWVQECYPNSQCVELETNATIDAIEEKLGNCSFDQLLWIAPGPVAGVGYDSEAQIVDQQETGVLAVFRIVKALLRLGYANKKLQWTFVTSRTQRVIETETIDPIHAGVAGLAGSLAKENVRWDLRILDVDSLTSVTAQDCLSLPWDKQGNMLAHREGGWFQQGLEVMVPPLPQGTPVYRQNGVYVVIGGAGGLGEVWTRFMMDQYQANVVWIGRRPYDAVIEDKLINSLTRLGRAPLYISADATNVDSLEEACKTILETYPAIHGVVHSAIVLHDQSIARMDESKFKASLSAKVDVSVNMDRVFGKHELDFMLFFSSIASFFKTPGQSNYSAGCVFKDSFAQKLQEKRAYPVKVMNWGYWGSVGVAADEFHRKVMEQMGMGSIEPQEGMAALEALVNSDIHQALLIKTLNNQAFAGASLSETIASLQQRAVKTITSQSSAGHQQAGSVKADENQKPTTVARPSEDQIGQMTSAYIERVITEKLSEAVKIDTAMIANDAPFAEFGVDSIIGVNLVRQISETLGIDLPLESLFEATNVSELAELIVKLGKSDSAKTEKKDDNRTIRPVDRTQFERLPLSFGQERVWFFEQLEQGSARYNLPMTFMVNGGLDINDLDQAFNLIIARHEILRTVFPSQEGQAQQLILNSLDFKLERINLSQYQTKAECNSKAREICQADAETPFDLAQGPLFRGKVIKLAEQEHILMLNMHHIISDGWSMGVLIRELGLILESLRRGRRPELAPLPIQYADYSVWQRIWLEEGGLVKQQLAYWQEKLSGLAESLDLPVDYPRPSVQSFAGASQTFVLDAKVTSQLKSLAEQKGGTLFMMLLAALKALLHRYTGQQDICVGSLIAGRQYAETEGLIGMFANTLALRSQVDGEDTFSALLSQVKTTCLEAYKHQDTPIEKVVDMLRHQRNMATSPIFQVMVILQNAAFGVTDQHFQPYPLDISHTEFDLSFQFMETPEGLAGSIDYGTALYKPQTITRLTEHFVTLCRAIISTPRAKISDLGLMGEAEKQQLLADFNNTRADYLKEKSIHQLLAEQVVTNPDKTAATFGEQSLNYQQLYDKSRDLGLYLQSLGVKPDSIVALCVERSLEMMIAIMGTAQAGGAYLPIDPGSPEDRLAYVFEDSQAVVVLTQEKFKNRIKPHLAPGTKLIALDKQWPEISKSVAVLRAKKVELRREAKSHHAAYVIYTASSTGKPKGIVVEYRALVNRIHWMQKRYALTQDDVVLQRTPYDIHASVWEFFWPVLAGSSVVFAAPDKHEDIDHLVTLIHKANVTTLHLSPSMLNGFLERAQDGCGGVKRVFCGGEGVDRKSAERFKMRMPHSLLQYLYSPAEASGFVTAYDCFQLNHSSAPIGAPIDNMQIYVLDQHDHLQPIGIPGELYIAGDSLARGYLNRPELTQEQFVSNPFQPEARMYKTGEMARWLDDGNVQLVRKSDITTGETESGGEQVLEKVWWQEVSLDDSYEKVTF
jgi:amino acid adenylation domain-containing protein